MTNGATFNIADCQIGPGFPVLVIAEIGVNHDGSVARALELVEDAADAGADAVKLQVFKAASLIHPSCSLAEYQKNHVAEDSASDMLRRYELYPDELQQIVQTIRSKGLIPLATPFSPSDLHTLKALELPAIKIASPDLVNWVLLHQAAALGKPLLLSTGAATLAEIQTTAGWMADWKAPFALLHCISSYPVDNRQANLCWITELARFGVPVGYSDHTTEELAGALAVAVGAYIVEKHLTFDRKAPGPDHAASAGPDEFIRYVKAIRLAERMRGAGGKSVLKIEDDVRRLSRQSLVLKHALAAGQPIRETDLTVQRPGTGIPPTELPRIVGKRLKQPVEAGTMLEWTMVHERAMRNLQELPFSPSKDLESLGFFRSSLLRWVWKIYTQRLTRAGRWFLWPSAVVIALGSISLQVQAYVPLAYVFALWAVAFIAMLLCRPRVKFTALLADRVCAGEALTVDIELEQLGGLGASDLLVLPHRLPGAVDADPDDGAVVRALRRGQKARVSLALRCNRRGVYPFHGFRVESDFPFGLLLASRKFDQPRTLTVYPKFTRLNRLDLPTGRRFHPGGVALASSIGESFEYIGNREYRDGDNLRDIDWRATARLCRPIVREYRDEYFLRVAVILDTHVPARAKQPARDAFERAVSLSAAISDHMARQDYLVDIFAAGPNLYHLTAGRSLAYLDQILDILACVQENPDEPFEIIEPQLMEYLSRITTVICVFLDWNDSRRDFVHRLSMQGAGVKVLIVRDSDCTLDPVADADVIGRVPIVDEARFNAGIGEL